MQILFLGDIVGRGARRAIRRTLRRLRSEASLEFVIANGENASGGRGLDPDAAEELFDSGVDVLTTGNHVWQHDRLVPMLEREPRVLRPANFPEGNPGRGFTVQVARNGARIGVINLIGRAFMGPADCPFRAADRALSNLEGQPPIVFVDMHGETTSEKVAMGWYLAGRASAVVGSHTHVQTADERVLPGGTAYLTDAGMCGPTESVIGMRKEEVLRRFLTQRPERFEVARGPIVLQGAIVDVDPESGRAASIRRYAEMVEE
jgi:2',3'-cyclic-nucleotide 2'-phosphodiesterase